MRISAVFSLLLISSCLAPLLLSSLEAQQRSAASDGGPNLPAQIVGPGDLLAVSIYGAPELTRTLRVSADGTIRLAMLQEPISVRGAMPAEIEKRIAVSLATAQILVAPDVTVTISEYATRPVSVVGSVRHPLTFQVSSATTLLDAIARAEGLSPDAGGEILVTRAATENGVAMMKRVAVKDLIENGDPAANIELTGGEEVRVPEIGRVFVVGNVMRPGAFPAALTDGMTLRKALALAEGLSAYATKEAYIYRPSDGGEQQEVMVPLRKIMDRKSADVKLSPGDILYVPDDRRSRLTAGMINKLVTFGAGTASGALIYSIRR